MGSCLSKNSAKVKQQQEQKPAKDQSITETNAPSTPTSVTQPGSPPLKEKPLPEDEAVKEMLSETSTVAPAGDGEIAEKPSVAAPPEDAAAAPPPLKTSTERSSSLKKKGSFKKDQASQPSIDGTVASSLTRSSSAKEDVDAILIQCGRLSRSSSGKTASNDTNGRQLSGSKRQAAEEETVEKHRARPSHRRSSSRDLTVRSASADSGSKRLTGRRISPSPVRRAEPSPGRRSENRSAGEKSKQSGKQNAAVSKRPAPAKRGSNSGELGNCTNGVSTSRSRSPAPRIDGGSVFPQSLSRSSSRKAEQSPYRRPLEEPAKNDEESGKIIFSSSSASAAQILDENEPVKKEKRVALKEINGNSKNIRDQLLSCRGAPTLKAAKVFDEISEAKSGTDKRNGETVSFQASGAEPSDQINGAVNVDGVLAQISRSRSARRSRDQVLLDSQALFDVSEEMELKGFPLPASVSKAQSILEAVADLNSSVDSNSSLKRLASESVEQGKSSRFLTTASYEADEKSEIMREFQRNVSARNSNADWTEQSQEESAGSNSQAAGSRFCTTRLHRYEEQDLTSFGTSAKATSRTYSNEDGDENAKSSSSLKPNSARYFNISPEDVLLNPYLGIKGGDSSSCSNLVPVITLGKKEFQYGKRSHNLQNGRSFDMDFKVNSRAVSDPGACSRGNFNTCSEQ